MEIKMNYLSKFQNKIHSFKNDTSGSFAIITAFMLVVLVGVSGFALDYSRIFNARSKIASAADSAVLAVGNNFLQGITDEGRNRQDFEAMLNVNLEGIIPLGNLEIASFSADPDTGEVKADIQATMPVTLLAVLGFDDVDIAVNAGAIFEQQDVEIAMVLDNTGSMRGSRINALRDAARDAVEILIPEDTSRNVRIGIVPYAASVNAGDFAREATRDNDVFEIATLGEDISGFVSGHNNVPTNGCVTERGGREEATDASFEDFPVGSDSRTVTARRNSGLACPTLEIRPLTNTKRDLLRDIDRMGARGTTAGHIGISWAYYMLSENWAELWPRSADPAPYSSDVRKVAIIMTDGIFNTFYNGTEELPSPVNQNGNQRTRSEQLARDLCANMKAEVAGNPGILVYTIAFEAPEQAQEVLQDCANENTNQDTFYFEADNSAELQSAFREIATSIQSLRLAQ